MKKLYRFVLIIFLFVSSITPAFADGFGGGDRGVGWSSGGYDLHPSRWFDYIAWGVEDTANRLTTISSRLAYTVNGVTYSAASSLYTIRSKVGDIASDLSSISSKLSTSNSNLNNINDNLKTTVGDYSYNVARMLKYSTDGTDYTAGRLLYNIYNRLGSDGIIAVRLDDIRTSLNTSNSDLDTIANNLTTMVGNTSFNVARMLKYSINGTDYTAGRLLYGIWDRLGDVGYVGIRLDDIRDDIRITNSKLDGVISAINSITISGDISVSPYNDTAVRTALNNIYSRQQSVISSITPLTDISAKLNKLADIELSLGGLDISGSSFDDTVLAGKLDTVSSHLSNIYTRQNSIISAINSISVPGSSSGGSTIVTSSNPYARKIYGALYGGVDGAGDDIVDVASSQLGVTEGEPYYTWYGFDSHVAWCACFVSWCADQCGCLGDVIPKFALVDDGVAWFQDHDLWLDAGAVPSAGDIIFFDWDSDNIPDHVGIVSDCEDDVVHTIEGNKGDSPGAVDTRAISVDSPLIMGYGAPDYPASGSSGSSVYSVLSDISYKLDHLSVSDNFDDTALLEKLDDIENTLSNLDGAVTEFEISVDNEVYDVFYVDGGEDDDQSIVDLSKDGVKVFGDLLDFLYKAMIKDSLSGADGSIGDLADFYFDDGEGADDVWAS